MKAEICIRHGVPILVIVTDTWTEDAAMHAYAGRVGLAKNSSGEWILPHSHHRRTADAAAHPRPDVGEGAPDVFIA